VEGSRGQVTACALGKTINAVPLFGKLSQIRQFLPKGVKDAFPYHSRCYVGKGNPRFTGWSLLDILLFLPPVALETTLAVGFGVAPIGR
jgi:hypothetical protein